MKRLLWTLALIAFSAAPALASPASDVQGAMIMLGTAKSYHVTFTAKGKTGDIDVVKPDKMHVVMPPMEMVKIGDTSYMKMGGTWRKFTIPGMSEQITSMYEGAIHKVSSHADDVVVTDLGSKVVDGASLHAYVVKNKDAKEPTTVYIDGRGEPARLETADGTVVRFSKINDPIAIDAPI